MFFTAYTIYPAYTYVSLWGFMHICVSHRCHLVINSMIMMPPLMTLKYCSPLLLLPDTIAALSHSDRENLFRSLRSIDTLIDVKVSEQVNQA